MGDEKKDRERAKRTCRREKKRESGDGGEKIWKRGEETKAGGGGNTGG